SPDEAPPLAPGQVRVWFLRLLLPGTQMHPPQLYINGAPIGISAQGTVFYRDLTPGPYTFDVENCVPQPGAAQSMTLVAGRQYLLEVGSDENGHLYCVPPQVSYLRQVPPQQVPYLFAQVSYGGAR